MKTWLRQTADFSCSSSALPSSVWRWPTGTIPSGSMRPTLLEGDVAARGPARLRPEGPPRHRRGPRGELRRGVVTFTSPRDDMRPSATGRRSGRRRRRNCATSLIVNGVPAEYGGFAGSKSTVRPEQGSGRCSNGTTRERTIQLLPRPAMRSFAGIAGGQLLFLGDNRDNSADSPISASCRVSADRASARARLGRHSRQLGAAAERSSKSDR